MTRLRLAPHVHSSFSDDCDWQLAKLVRMLKLLRYDGVLLCEHDRTMTAEMWELVIATCRLLSTPSFIIVPGIEYQDPCHRIHMPVYGELPFMGRSPQIGDAAAMAAEYAGVSVLAHPARRSAYRLFDQRWARHLTGIEVWNRKYDGVQPNSWAVGTASAFALAPFVALDFHGPRQVFPLSLDVMLDGPPSVDGIVQAILAGNAHPSMLSLPLDTFTRGRMTSVASRAEQVRHALAPWARRTETLLRLGDQRTDRTIAETDDHICS